MAGKASIIAGSVLAAGIIGAGTYGLLGESTRGGEESDGGLEPVQMEHEPTEAELCNKAVRSSGGRLVRVVGVAVDPGAEVNDTSVGRAVEISAEDLNKNTLCNVVFKAKNKDGRPDLPALEKYYGIASAPVLLDGSCAVDGCYWNMLLSGIACKEAGDVPGYVGSETDEFLTVPEADKARFLRTAGRCTFEDKELYCQVPYGDPKAVVGAPVFLPHAWAGRKDLNYPQVVDGKPEPRPLKAKVAVP